MNTISMKEANQNFSNAAKLVEENGIIYVTKHGKEKYVMMTIEKFNGKSDFEEKMLKKTSEGFWIDQTKQAQENAAKANYNDTGRTLCKVYSEGDKIKFLRLHFFEGEDIPESCGELTLPLESITFIDGEVLQIKSREKKNIRYSGAYTKYPEEKKEKEIVEKALLAARELKEDPEIIPAETYGEPIVEA